jgi:recombination protein RecT
MSDQPSASRALNPIDEVRQAIDRMGPQFKMVLPPQIPVEKFVRVVQTAVMTNPDLANPEKCEKRSLYASAMRLAQDGLLPDGREAAIVTFKGKAQAMPMVAGILKKVRQSGELLSISAHVVYEKDAFDYVLGDDERIEHKPSLEENRGRPIVTYAIAKTKDGGIYREVMTEAQVQAVRKVSRSGDGGPWAGPFADEMRKKTALRRLSKRLPMSTDVEDIIRRDDDLFMPPAEGEQQATQPQQQAQDAEQAQPRRPRALSKVVDQAQQQATDVMPRAVPPREPGEDDDIDETPPAGHPAAEDVI